MAVLHAIYWLLTLSNLDILALGQEDSLRSALNAIDRRQRDLSEYEYSEYGRPEEVAFLNSPSSYEPPDYTGRTDFLGQPDYLEDDIYNPNSYNKRITSAFRERDRQKQLDEFARTFMAGLEDNGIPGSTFDDNNYVQGLWERYYGNNDMERPYYNKRYYYPVFGGETVGLRKRGRYSEPMYNVHHHSPREEDGYQIKYLRNFPSQKERGLSKLRKLYSFNNPDKNLPIAKRSSSYSPPVTEKKMKKETDPKVQKDLSSIFGTAATAKPTSKPSDKPPKKYQKNTQKKGDTGIKEDINKEVFSPVPAADDNPRQIKKKSVKWSDYFGLDRRKKSEDGLDKEWLLERYHKAVAISNKKRNAEIPQDPSHKHGDGLNKVTGSEGKDDSLASEEKKIEDLSEKLQKMEDKVIQDTIKYTGSHEDDDGTEIQEVKDNVISRLAAAYSLEKMKNALEEYKKTVTKEKARLRQEGKLNDDYLCAEKRATVPRKEAIDESKETVPKTENDIKCGAGSEDCFEQNYKTPSDVVVKHMADVQCPPIEMACKEAAESLPQHGHIFESACNVYQMCLLCNDRSWSSAYRHCNIQFLTKSLEMCRGEKDCQKASSHSLQYLVDVNRALETEIYNTDDCDISCPMAERLLI